MYELYYNRFKKYNSDSKLFWILVAVSQKIRNTPYKIIKNNSGEFDTNNYDKYCEHCNLKNKNVITVFKDNLSRIYLEEYCSIRSKNVKNMIEKDQLKIQIKFKGIMKCC